MEGRTGTDVLICGAGAAGLTLAIDLARRGVRLRLVDKLAGPFAGSRGKGIQPRTQEVFEDLGIIDRIAAAGGAYPPQRSHRADGSHHDSHDIAVEPPTATEPYRTGLLVPQSRTEAVMRERLAELGGAPEYGRELVGFVQDEAGVTAQVSGPGGREAIRCRFLVGGDGGRSLVRHALGVGFPGKALGVRAIVADLAMDGLSRDAWHRFNDGEPGRLLLLCPLPHGEQFQLQAPIPLDGEADLTVAGLQALVDARAPGRGIVVRRVGWASAYGMSARLAERYRAGRVFLMGDAANTHPPTGGQGLNTSVQDAYNLGWKLGAVLAGAPDALLDTFEEERRPVAADMLGLSTRLLEGAKGGTMRRGREVHQLDIGYAGSSLSLDARAREGGVAAGERAPDAPVQGAGGQPTRLFRLFQGPHWTLLARGQAPAPHRMLHVHQVGPAGELRDTGGHLGSAYGMADGELLLVRPDGYVGARIAAGEGERLAEYMARTGIGASPGGR